MRVAILSQYFQPEPIARLRGLVRGLQEAGDEVEVLTAIPNWPPGQYYDGYQGRLIQDEWVEGVHIVRTYVWPYRGSATWKRLLNYSSFMISALWGARVLADFDLLYVYHPPLTISLPAVLISRSRKVPFIYDVQDVWPQAGVVAQAVRPGMLYSGMEKWASWAYAQATHITVLAQSFVEQFATRGTDRNKISVIPNWADESIYYPRDRQKAQVSLDLEEKTFVVMYAGNMGTTHGVEYILDAAALVQSQSQILFLMVGTGAEYESLVNYKNKLGLENVRFVGFVEPKNMPDLLAAADLMLVHMRHLPTGDVSFPSRIPAYMACSRPILVAAEGVTRQVVDDADCGLTCGPEDASQIAALIVQAFENSSDLATKGEHGREYYLQNLSEKVVVPRLVDLIHTVAGAVPTK